MNFQIRNLLHAILCILTPLSRFWILLLETLAFLVSDNALTILQARASITSIINTSIGRPFK